MMPLHTYIAIAIAIAAVISCGSVANAFVTPQSRANVQSGKNASSKFQKCQYYYLHSRKTSTHHSRPTTTASTTSSSMHMASLPSMSMSMSLPPVDSSALTQYFLETLISYGVPAFFWLVIIAFAAKSFKSARKDARGAATAAGPNGGLFGQNSQNVVNQLYDDLYDSTGDENKSPFSMFRNRGNSNNNNAIPKNIGIPKTQYLQITKLNDIYSSYQYSLTAATQSKAKAAAIYRSQAFDSAIQRALDSSVQEISNAQKSDLLLEEKEFLNKGSEIMDNVLSLQYALTQLIIKDEMDAMDVDIGEVDIDIDNGSKNDTNVIDATIVVDDGDTKSSTVTSTGNNTTGTISTTATTTSTTDDKKKKTKTNYKKDINKMVKEIEKQNTELLRLEMEFIRAVVEIMGPDRANGIRSALLGNIAGGGAGTGIAGGLLKTLQDRPLSQVLSTIGYSTNNNHKSHDAPLSRNLFVTDFPGDVSASQVETLREEVTAIIKAAKPGDEALLILQTGGGTVTGYGLAAAQLQRFKKHGMKLTICVEQVAASGGYMMTCVADKVIASPFAVLGSIGVISDLPNVYERLKSEGIEFQTVTAGKYKRTLTPTKKVTQEDVDKQKEDLEDILTLFKAFVKENRPSLDIDTVATGETWFGEDALERGLCDEIRTVDDVLVDYVDSGYNVYQVRYDPNGIGRSPLGSLLPFGSAAVASTNNDIGEKGIVGGVVRWLVRNIVPALKDEIAKELNIETSNTAKVQERYMFRDPANSSKNIKVEC